jgi:hypothetical protein
MSASDAAREQAPISGNPDALEVAPGTSHQQLEGWIPQLANEEEIRQALEKAFDYRGDVVITRKDGNGVEGYIFDRRTGSSLADSFVRVIPTGKREKLSIAYSDIAALKFSDRDPAAGKSFEAWVRKYWEKRAAGEKNIQISPETLE